MANLPNQRPQLNVPYCMDIPVIDLSLEIGSDADRAKLMEQILKALDEYKSFQVINHGVPRKVMEDAIEVYREIFNLSTNELAEISHSRKHSVYIDSEKGMDTNRFLTNILRHDCHPLEQTIDSWPKKPDRYRKVIAEYALGTKKVSQKILELIGEGLGIRKGYFDGELTHEQILQVKCYSKSPDPNSSDGCWEHCDPNLLTLIQTNVAGLLLHKHEQWVAVPPLPNAFFVMPGMKLEIISNGEHKSTPHKVVRNAEADRISIGVFIDSSNHTKIEPAKEVLNNGKTRPEYKALTHAELSEKFRKKLFADESALASFLLLKERGREGARGS